MEKGRNHSWISTTEDIDKRYESTLEVITIMIVDFKNRMLLDSLFFTVNRDVKTLTMQFTSSFIKKRRTTVSRIFAR